jgi:hypothetical protein
MFLVILVAGQRTDSKKNQGIHDAFYSKTANYSNYFCDPYFGVDIAKFKHVARAQDFRGVEFDKPITFENNLEGFEYFVNWFRKIMSKHGCEDVLVGMEPTGHYWLNHVYYFERTTDRVRRGEPVTGEEK